MFTTKLGSSLKVVSGRHTVLILFAQGVDDRIKDFSVASKFTSGIDLRQVPFALSLKVPFSASSSITPSITQFLGSSQFWTKSFIPKTVL